MKVAVQQPGVGHTEAHSNRDIAKTKVEADGPHPRLSSYLTNEHTYNAPHLKIDKHSFKTIIKAKQEGKDVSKKEIEFKGIKDAQCDSIRARRPRTIPSYCKVTTLSEICIK